MYAAVTFSPDGRRLAAASTGGFIKLWDTETLQEVQQLNWRRGWIQGQLAFTPDGDTLVGACPDGIRVWRAARVSEINQTRSAN
jgi:WD40 repeat protein